jgi:hypothetical protein
MKKISLKPMQKYFVAMVIGGIMITGFNSCSKKSSGSKSKAATSTAVTEPPTPPAPLPPAKEEKGEMVIKRDAAGNYVVQLNVKNLEAVQLMKPAKEGYVVWIVSEGMAPQNVGQIDGAKKWKEKKDNAYFEATSAVKPTKIFITAENDLKAVTPGTQLVWSTKTF